MFVFQADRKILSQNMNDRTSKTLFVFQGEAYKKRKTLP